MKKYSCGLVEKNGGKWVVKVLKTNAKKFKTIASASKCCIVRNQAKTMQVYLLGEKKAWQVYITTEKGLFVGPDKTEAVIAKKHYILFMQNGQWYAQYLNGKEAILLGRKFTLGTKATSDCLYFEDDSSGISFLAVAREDRLCIDPVETTQFLDLQSGERNLVAVSASQERLYRIYTATGLRTSKIEGCRFKLGKETFLCWQGELLKVS